MIGRPKTLRLKDSQDSKVDIFKNLKNVNKLINCVYYRCTTCKTSKNVIFSCLHNAIIRKITVDV